MKRREVDFFFFPQESLGQESGEQKCCRRAKILTLKIDERKEMEKRDGVGWRKRGRLEMQREMDGRRGENRKMEGCSRGETSIGEGEVTSKMSL